MENVMTGKMEVNRDFLVGLINGLWNQFDEDNNGYLTRQEVKKFIIQLVSQAEVDEKHLEEIDPEVLDDMFDKIDVSKDGTITR